MGIPSALRNIIVGIPVGFLFFNQIGYIARVEGVSMQPALNPDIEHEDYVFLNRWAVRNKNISRGDIVTFKSPKFPNQKLIKRVIGLSGDVINTLGYRNKILEVHYYNYKINNNYYYYIIKVIVIIIIIIIVITCFFFLVKINFQTIFR